MADPVQILERAHDSDFLKDFIKTSRTSITAEMNETRVASEIFAVYTLNKSAQELQRGLLTLSGRIEDAITLHAIALNKSAEKANEHTRGLKYATYALVFATLCLVAITALQYFGK